MSRARKEDYWEQFDDSGDLEDAARYIEKNPDASVAEVLGQCELDLDRRDDVQELIDEIATDVDEPETRVGHWMADDDCDVYAGRADRDGKVRHFGNSPIGDRGWLGNPFVPRDSAAEEHFEQEDMTVVADRDEAIARFTRLFCEAVSQRPALRRALFENVRGRVLGCWCQHVDEDEPACHAEVIADVADDAIEKRGGRE